MKTNKRIFVYKRITKPKTDEQIQMKSVQSTLAELVIIKQIIEN